MGKASSKYTEILKLKELMEKADIPFDWKEGHLDGYQLCYPDKETFTCSVIEFSGSYGSNEDRLEILGLMTEEEKQKEDDDVLGYLTADEVFERIQEHWKTEQKKRKDK